MPESGRPRRSTGGRPAGKSSGAPRGRRTGSSGSFRSRDAGAGGSTSSDRGSSHPSRAQSRGATTGRSSAPAGRGTSDSRRSSGRTRDSYRGRDTDRAGDTGRAAPTPRGGGANRTGGGTRRGAPTGGGRAGDSTRSGDRSPGRRSDFGRPDDHRRGSSPRSAESRYGREGGQRTSGSSSVGGGGPTRRTPTARGPARRSTGDFGERRGDRDSASDNRDRRSGPPSDRGSTRRDSAGDSRPRRPAPTDRRATRRAPAGDTPDRRRAATNPRRRSDQPDRSPRPPRTWGSLARRGARELGEPTDGPTASEVWRQAIARAEGTDTSQRAHREEPWEPDEVWISEPLDERADEAPRDRKSRPLGQQDAGQRDLATGREGVAAPGGRRRTVPRQVVDELSSSAGPLRGAKLANRIADATYAFDRERYQEARRILKTLVEEAPNSPAVRELNGLVLYRTGQWSAAAKELERYRELSGSHDQHPVLADCYRAMRRYEDAEAIWQDLREASPSGDLVAEGRIVAAGCRADHGDLGGGIALLEKALRRVNRPQERHLRQWYALADLYERAGDVPRARDLFNRVASADPQSFDVKSRLRALR